MLQMHVQIWVDGGWHRAGDVRIDDAARGTASPARFDYDFEYLDQVGSALGARDYRAVSCRHPLGYQPWSGDAWPAFLLDVIPTGAARRTWERELGLPNTPSSDWPLLLHGGDNPPGNLRILEAAERSLTALPTAAHAGFERAAVIERAGEFLEYARAHGAGVAGGSGAGGDAPKFLLREDHEGRFHADGALDDARTQRCWLVKFPRSGHAADRLVLEVEASYLRVAARLGVRVHDVESVEWISDALFVPRFDRRIHAGVVERFGLESLCSLCGVSEFGASIPKRVLAAAIAEHTTAEPADELREFLLRDVLDLALGNSDNHARNTAVSKTPDGRIVLSPLYDFAPMFLDPQGIVRSCRWRSERGSLPDWRDVREELVGLLPSTRVNAYFAEFGELLAALPAQLRDAGIPTEVMARRMPSIELLRRALEET